jgi:hypothetical protein
MKNTLGTLLIVSVLSGCNQINPVAIKKDSKTFQDPNAYAQGKWSFLAESISKLWYYDSSSLTKNPEGVVSFESYSISASKLVGNDKNLQNIPVDKMDGMNPQIYGPYIQKIDCLFHYHSSQSMIDGSCDLSEAPPEVRNSGMKDQMDCWRKIKPKTAIAFIENRVCGRKLPMETIRNYFLFQDDPLISGGVQSNPVLLKDSNLHADGSSKFYDVVNNEYILIDAKRNIRQMRVTSYILDKNLSSDGDYLYQASCSEKVDRLAKIGQGVAAMKPIGNSISFSGVAFNRICANHNQYMQLVKNFSR